MNLSHAFTQLLPAPRPTLAFIAFVALTVGLWWERPSLALIVPGSVALVCLAVTHLRGEDG